MKSIANHSKTILCIMQFQLELLSVQINMKTKRCIHEQNTEKSWTSPFRGEEKFIELKQACPRTDSVVSRKPANRAAPLWLERDSLFQSYSRRLAVKMSRFWILAGMSPKIKKKMLDFTKASGKRST